MQPVRLIGVPDTYTNCKAVYVNPGYISSVEIQDKDLVHIYMNSGRVVFTNIEGLRSLEKGDDESMVSHSLS